MRKRFVWMATALLALGTAGAASAAVLNWEGTMTSLWADFPPAELSGGGVATINGSDGVIPAHLSTLRLAPSRGQIKGTFTRFLTDPDTFGNGVYALVFDNVGGLTGTWGQLSGGAGSTTTGGGILPVGGLLKMCLFSTACTSYYGMILNQPTTVNGVPGSKGVGVGGTITAGGYGGLRWSLQAAPWTIKTATVIDQITPKFNPANESPPPKEMITWVANGWAHGPASNTTATAQPGGMVQLVTPSQIVTNLPYGSMAKIGTLVIVVIRFIPEPGPLLLLGSGVAGLALLGRRRLRQ